MSMRNVIKKLEAKHERAERRADFHAKQEAKAKSDESREFNAKEKNFWRGIAYGIGEALAVVVQEEVTGGTPF